MTDYDQVLLERRRDPHNAYVSKKEFRILNFMDERKTQNAYF